ncbi:uncharacterized protein [Panulirus ornatus]|uniref:uncharacterized protein n=1 Tax=Panulirus ornatus TaxID=150431 RepID=UPI003A84BC0B
MSSSDAQIKSKLGAVLQSLKSYQQQGQECQSPELARVEDDTMLNKLHTHVHILLKNKNGYEWAQDVGLVTFVQTVLEPSVVSNTKNSSTVSFALKVLASLISVEENFDTFAEDKVLCHFLVILPSIRSDPALSSSALSLVQSICKHRAGPYWLVKNGIWEKMLLPCLRSPSLFVQREGVNVIASFMLLLTGTQHFESLVKDLCLISGKFCELRQHLSTSEGEELRQSTLCVLSIFKQIYLQTLGKVAIYSQIQNISDISSRLIATLKGQIPTTSVTCITDVLILNSLHRFQEKLMGYGILEQFLLDSVCVDMISLPRLLLEKGYIESFFRSSVNTHKYWKVMVQNLKETKDIDLTSVEALLHIVTNFQVTPMLVLYRASLDEIFKQCPEKCRLISKWNDEIHSQINIKEDHKVDATKLEKQIVEVLEQNPEEAIRMSVICISSIISAADHLNLTCAVTVFQGLVFLLGSQECVRSPMKHHGALQRAVIDGLRILVEKFNIDWRKCYVSVCLMGKLCDIVKIPGISTQVKVSTLKAMNSCISGFIPPVMSMLLNSEKLEHNSVELMGQVLTIYLGDVDWEVRDSALEVLITSMKLAKEKYPHFVDWLLRYNLHYAVLTALGDVEGYVRASALIVLANIISIDKVSWFKSARKQRKKDPSTLIYINTHVHIHTCYLYLFNFWTFSEEEVNGLVVRVIQHSAEDPDDEMRLAALEFIHHHILWTLSKSGMVDGEFPSVTFSKGKILKLDKEEVKSRVHSVLMWICECGYMFSLLECLKDLVTSVATRARDTFTFLNDLITRYEIQLEGSVRNRKASESSNLSTKIWQGTKVEKPAVVSVAGHLVPSSENVTAKDKIDRTITDILSSSALDTVSMIKRPYSDSMSSTIVDPRNLLLTLDDIPPANPTISFSCLLQSIDDLCQTGNSDQDERYQINEMISLLDDILLEGSHHQSHSDDQRLRDCY